MPFQCLRATAQVSDSRSATHSGLAAPILCPKHIGFQISASQWELTRRAQGVFHNHLETSAVVCRSPSARNALCHTSGADRAAGGHRRPHRCFRDVARRLSGRPRDVLRARMYIQRLEQSSLFCHILWYFRFIFGPLRRFFFMILDSRAKPRVAPHISQSKSRNRSPLYLRKVVRLRKPVDGTPTGTFMIP